MGNFINKVKAHLGKYKENTLKISEDGVFIHNGKKYEYDHIIPKDRYQLNILEKYRTDFFDSSYSKNITLHRYFHHLNSSQAMCINFFYPLINEKLLEKILEVLNVKGSVNYDEVCFEKESELERSSERKTNFDFYIKLVSGINLFFEIKYTENGFGKPKHDAEHKNKFKNTYKPLLDKNPAIKKEFKNESTFLNNYQIMRNLLNINNDSYVIFIYPKDNNPVDKEAFEAKQMINDSWQNHFILLTWEEISKKLITHLEYQKLKDYYSKEFINKYLN